MIAIKVKPKTAVAPYETTMSEFTSIFLWYIGSKKDFIVLRRKGYPGTG